MFGVPTKVCFFMWLVTQVTGKFRGNHNPYDMGCTRNCLYALCSPKKPRYMHYQMKVARASLAAGSIGQAPPQRSTTQQQRPPPAPLEAAPPPGSQNLHCAPVYEELDTTSSVGRGNVQVGMWCELEG